MTDACSIVCVVCLIISFTPIGDVTQAMSLMAVSSIHDARHPDQYFTATGSDCTVVAADPESEDAKYDGNGFSCDLGEVKSGETVSFEAQGFTSSGMVKDGSYSGCENVQVDFTVTDEEADAVASGETHESIRSGMDVEATADDYTVDVGPAYSGSEGLCYLSVSGTVTNNSSVVWKKAVISGKMVAADPDSSDGKYAGYEFECTVENVSPGKTVEFQSNAFGVSGMVQYGSYSGCRDVKVIYTTV